MKNKLLLFALLLAGLAACRKQSQTPEEGFPAGNTEIRSQPPGSLTPGGPYPNPMEWAFGNALQAGMPCDVAFATCGVWEPTFPFPGNMNYYTSAPASLEVNSAGDLAANIDGTQLAPVIKQQALSGAPFVLAHNTALPQSAVLSAYSAAGLEAPAQLVMDAGSYNTTIENNPGPVSALIKIKIRITVTVTTASGDVYKLTITVTIRI
jgi:hypothetical protein